jgi:hypothetical protein
MPKTLPLVLGRATISLFAADSDGLAILTQPIWVGARAEGLELSSEITEQDATPSGEAYDQFAQLSELHEIKIDRIWVLPIGDGSGPGAVPFKDYDLRRGQYVMQIFGIDEKTGIWHQRTYLGVQARRYDLRSNGQDYFGSNQLFRAKSFTTTGGTSTPDGTLTPVTPSSSVIIPLLFTHDDPLINGDYFIGTYQFDSAVTIGFAKIIGETSAGSDTVATLEINGSLTANTLTLTAGSGEQSDSDTFSVSVPAGHTIRWKVTSAPGSGRAEFVGITMNVTQQS